MSFSARIIAWQRRAGRHDLPWQGGRDAYRIWLSEVMLQQTQVATVIPYYQRFLARFPDVAALAAAPLDAVMEAWAGLGYYSRARNLHRCAQAVMSKHGGCFPCTAGALVQLPGIGRSTAAAIAVFAGGERAAILDGNVKRVLARHFGVAGFPGAAAVQRALWAVAERELPDAAVEAYTQGLMDLGATVCLRQRPRCDACPVRPSCIAALEARTAELPAPRPPRARPERTAVLALIVDAAGCVLLERRAASGVWGGLLTAPEFAAELPDAALPQAVAARFGLRVGPARPLARVRHDFTHYRLWLLPRVLHVEAAAALHDAAGLTWLAPAAVADAALPAPLRRLLAALARRELAAAT
jgi:A/G-specific adenine glycosylase